MSVTLQALGASEERTDEEQLLGSLTVPHGSIAAAASLPCVDQAGEIDPREEEGGTSSGSGNVSRHHCALGHGLPALTSSISYSTDRTPPFEHVNASPGATLTPPLYTGYSVMRERGGRAVWYVLVIECMLYSKK